MAQKITPKLESKLGLNNGMKVLFSKVTTLEWENSCLIALFSHPYLWRDTPLVLLSDLEILQRTVQVLNLVEPMHIKEERRF